MALSVGSFAFIGYNADSEDDFAIVLLAPITTSETVFFTDSEWIGASFETAFPEGTLTWTTPSSLAAGTVVTFSNVAPVSGSNTTVATVSHGSLDQTSGGGGFISLSSAGDSILAYQGSAASPTFISGISTDNLGFTQNTSAPFGTLSGTGLVLGQTAVEIGKNGDNNSYDGAFYSAARDSGANFAAYGPLINNPANWTLELLDGESLLPFDSTAFSTGAADTTGPLLVSTAPADGGIDVDLFNNLTLTFNEAVQTGTGTITIRRTDDNSVFETLNVTSSAVTASGTTITINPAGNLETATRYHVEIGGNAIQDVSGNAFVGISDAKTFNFSTVLPTVGAAPAALGAGSIAFVGFSAEGSTDDLAIVALEDLDGSTIPFQIFITDQPWTGAAFNTTGDGTVIWTIDELIPAGTVINLSDLGSAAFDNTSDFTASRGFVSRDADFAPSTNGETVLAYVGALETPSAFLAGFATDVLGFGHSGGTLAGTGLVEGTTAANFGAIEDGLDGASYVGDRSTETSFAGYLDDINGAPLASNYQTANGSTPPNDNGEDFSPFPTASFAVSGPDVTAPALASTTPADAGANVAVGANLTATFNENVQLGTGNITIFTKTGDAVFEAIDVTSGQVTVSGATVTINPSANLNPATAYYVNIASGAIEDTAGNDYSGLANETGWNFSTAVPALTVPSLSAGDIAFTGYNAEGDEDLSFVVLADIDGAATPFQLFFTEKVWNGATFEAGSGTLIWTVTSAIQAGTVVTFTDVTTPEAVAFEASVGLLQENEDFNINISGDVVFAYKGTLGTPAANGFVAALATDELGFGSNPGGLNNTGLVEGQTAVNLSDGATSPDGGQFSGGRNDQTTFSAYATTVNTAANWTLEQFTGENILPFNATSFGLANSAPTVSTLPMDVTALEDAPSTLDLSAAEFADVDNDALTVTFSVDLGTFTAVADGDAVGSGVTETLVNATTVTLQGLAGDINSYLDTTAGLQYLGVSNVFGNDQATITVSANDGEANPTLGTINVDITAVDDPAVPVNDAIAIADDATATTGIDLFAANPTTADSDIDGPFSIVAVQGGMSPQPTANGGIVTVTNAANGLVTYDPNGAFEYLPVGNTATDTFTYTVSGGATATVTLTITGLDNNDIFDGSVLTGVINGGVGTNTVSYASSVTASLLDQAANTFDAAGDVYVNIQNLTGSDGNDTLIGTGVSFVDALTGDLAVNVLSGGLGDDLLRGGAGADTLDGGGGVNDTADYATSYGSVQVNLQTGLARSNHAEGDTLIGIENLTGSAFADTLIGNAFGNILTGLAGMDALNGGFGNDTLIGGADADILNGGVGTDVADYSGSAAGATVDLVAGTGVGGDAQGDTLFSIESIIGSDQNDTLIGTGVSFVDALTGDLAVNVLSGGLGDDLLRGGAGADTLDGGGGVNDTADYATSYGSVQVNLQTGLARSNHAEGDTLIGIENLTGSAFADTLIGNAFGNILTGLAGMDALNGGFGNDTLIGGADADILNGGVGTDVADYSGSAAGATVDLVAGTGVGGDAQGDTLFSIESIIGSDQNDTLIGTGVSFVDALTGDLAVNVLRGGLGDDLLRGGAGADTLDGGGGVNDTADYATSYGSVQVNLQTGLARLNHAEGDTLIGIENLTGSLFNDTLTGDSQDNVLAGLAGNNTLTGGDGADTFVFVYVGLGADTVTDFVTGTDTLDISALGINEAAVNVTDVGNDLLLTFDGALGLSVLLQGVSDVSGLDTTNDFLFV